VVNFILKDNFEGVEVQLNQSGFNHNQHNGLGATVVKAGFPVPGDVNYDGKSFDANILMGGKFAEGKGNATVFATFKRTDAALQSQRDFSACAIGSNANGFTCAGSGTNAAGRVGVNGAVGSFTNGPNGAVRAYSGATDSFNYGPTNFLQRPSDVYGVNARAHFDINDQVRVYEEFNFHSYSTDAQVAPGGVFFGSQATLRTTACCRQHGKRTGHHRAGSSVDVTIGKRNVEAAAPLVDHRHSFRRSSASRRHRQVVV
jgi:hypothetical protein